MGLLELLIVSIGVSSDAAAVAICKGLTLKKFDAKKALIIGLYFGIFQALMPCIGYLLGTSFEKIITSLAHWVAFILLSIIGFNMIRGALSKGKDNIDDKVDFVSMLPLSVATSIDALVIGVTFAILKVNILVAALLVGATAFIMCTIGVKVGNKFGKKYKKKAQIFGGIVVILIGLKILFEHLGILF